MPTFTHEIKIHAAYDKRNPNPKKNYGIHGAHIYFSVKTEDNEGLSFSVSTNWQLPHVQKEIDAKEPVPGLDKYWGHKPSAFSVDIHTKTPRYEGQSCIENCSITGGKCYADGSGMLGESFLETLITEGSEGLFKRMEQQFIDWKN